MANDVKELEGQLQITRVQHHEGEYIEIALYDDLSRHQFVRARISLAQFAQAVTGLAGIPCKLEVRNLERVGKVKEYKDARLSVPHHALEAEDVDSHDRRGLEKWLQKTQQRKGWIMDYRLSSQSSIEYLKKDVVLNFGYYRYVEAETS